MNLTNIINCPKCKKEIKVEELHTDGQRLTDGIISCLNCKYKSIIYQGIIINTDTENNRKSIEFFNEKYNKEIDLGFEEKAFYSNFVEENQLKTTKKHFSKIKIFLNMLYYVTVIIILYFYSLISKKDKNTLKTEIELLAEVYHYVPEMAIQKLIEMRVIKDNIPEKELGVILDIGGGNGIVTGTLLKDYNVKSKINVDLFASFSETYDFIISEDISKSMIKDNLVDTGLSICVFEHIPNATYLLKDIYSKLNNDGIFAFTTPKSEYYKGLFLYRILHLFSKKYAQRYAEFDIKHSSHCSLYEEEFLKNEILKARFKNVTAIPFYSKNQLLLFDCLNVCAKLPRDWHFWGIWQTFFWKKKFFKRIMISLLKIILYRVNETCNNKKNNKFYTHFLYVCKKGGIKA